MVAKKKTIETAIAIAAENSGPPIEGAVAVAVEAAPEVTPYSAALNKVQVLEKRLTELTRQVEEVQAALNMETNAAEFEQLLDQLGQAERDQRLCQNRLTQAKKELAGLEKGQRTTRLMAHIQKIEGAIAELEKQGKDVHFGLSTFFQASEAAWDLWCEVDALIRDEHFQREAAALGIALPERPAGPVWGLWYPNFEEMLTGNASRYYAHWARLQDELQAGHRVSKLPTLSQLVRAENPATIPLSELEHEYRVVATGEKAADDEEEPEE